MIIAIGYWFSVVAALFVLCGLTALAVSVLHLVVNRAIRLAGVQRVAEGLIAEDRKRGKGARSK